SKRTVIFLSRAMLLQTPTGAARRHLHLDNLPAQVCSVLKQGDYNNRSCSEPKEPAMRHSSGGRIGAWVAMSLLYTVVDTLPTPARAGTAPTLVPIVSLAGNWVSTATYSRGIVVRYRGQTYLSLRRSRDVAPSTNTA